MEHRTLVKLCGLRCAEDVETAVRLGADFLGFVFVPSSPRGLDVADAERMFGRVGTGPARRVGVFQDQPVELVRDAVRHCRLDLAQLHGRESVELAESLDVPVILVLRSGDAGGEARTENLPANTYAVLVDAADAQGRSGGLGKTVPEADFETVRAALPAETRLFLAGGLTPENVAPRVARHQPFAVDVSSGIESAPGVKDSQRMQRFVEAVRGAL